MEVKLSKGTGLAGIQFSQSLSFTGDVPIGVSTSVPVAQTGVLTVRTDNDTGSLTMNSASHGIITGQRLDLFWATGYRRGMTVGTVAGLVVPIDLGSGDNLPTASSTVYAATPIERAFNVVGDNLKLLLAKADAEAIFVFANSGGTELTFAHIQSGVLFDWNHKLGTTNPVAGVTIAKVYMSHGNTTAAKTLTAGALVSA